MASRISPYVDNTGLVFAYDLANIKRSYLGEPTVNIMPYSEQFNSWGTGNVVLTANAAVAPNGTQTAYFFGADNVATYHYIYQYLTTESSTTYTFSCHVKPAGGFNGSTNTFFMQTNDGSWKNTSFNLDTLSASSNGTVIPLKDGWYRVSWTVAIATGGSLFWSMYPSSSPTAESQGGGYYIWGAQLEAKGHMTQYLLTGASTVTRSATQGLVDLAGNSTIDLTNVSFDSNAQMTFDDTNDYIQLASDARGTVFDTQTFTIETVIYPTVDPDTSEGVIWSNDYTAHSNPFYAQHLRLGGSSGLSNELSFYWNNGSAVKGMSINNVIPTLNTYYHIAATYQSGYQAVYVNGELIESMTEVGTITYYNQEIWISRSNFGGYFGGDIPLLKFYNRTLTASEIQQNFNAIKGRYGF